VINTASSWRHGRADVADRYTASKGAVLALSRELGVEFARRGVRVNALCPGPSTRRCLQELFARTRRRPRGGSSTCRWAASAEASEIASAALFLASDESSYVNASTFLVDGGILLRLHHSVVKE
jgi:NAD(P)-dependent dehydrogenase (short-subunit alcohol dehydrogenase family)